LSTPGHGEGVGLSAGAGPALVVGLQWGDEGKGKIVDLLCEHFDAVVRYNGGANAGHSVVIDGRRFALHLLPTGILRPGAAAIISHGVVVDPSRLIEELDGLSAQGIDVSGLSISEQAHVVTPYHVWEDECREKVAGIDREGEIGTTRRGIGPCYADKALRSTAIRMGDLSRPDVLRSRLRAACAFKRAIFEHFAPERLDALDPDVLAGPLLEAGERLGPSIRDTTSQLHDLLDAGCRVLFEGANAILLDLDLGTFPYVTSSSCGVGGIGSTGVPPQRIRRVVGIAKAYCTRVGRGPMPTELTDELGERIREAGAEFGTTTGRPRRVGWLDLVALRYAARVNGATEIALTKLDVLGGVDTLRLCVGYRNASGEDLEFRADAGRLGEVAPVWKDIEGFPSESLGAARRWGELPAAARAYVEEIERFVEVPIRIIGVGPERESCVVREENS